MEQSPEGLVLRGSGASLLGVSLLIALIAVGMPVGLYLSGTPIGEACGSLSPSNVFKIWGIVLLLVLGLSLMSGYYYSRRLALASGQLRYSHWFADQSWPVGALTDLSYQESIRPGDVNSEEYLVFWRAGQEKAAKINLRGWDREELRRLVEAVRAQNPALVVSMEARRVLNLP